MKVKKMMMLLLTALALTAIAVAASAAQANGLFWYDDDEEFSPSLENKKEVEPFGEISLLVGEPPTQFVVGPCKLKFKGFLYNGNEAGEGEITQVAEGAGACSTNLAGCAVQESTFGNFPWSVAIDENGEVAIAGIEIEQHFSKGCGIFGVPSTVTTEGTATGLFSSYITEGNVPATLKFEESGDLTAAGVGPIDLSGQLKFGTKFTATTEP